MNEDYIKYVKSKSKLRYLAGYLFVGKTTYLFRKELKRRGRKEQQ